MIRLGLGIGLGLGSNPKPKPNPKPTNPNLVRVVELVLLYLALGEELHRARAVGGGAEDVEPAVADVQEVAHPPVRANEEHARRGRPLDLDLRQAGVQRPGGARYVRLGRGLGLGWVRGKPPCASGACSTEGTGTRSLYVQYRGPGAHVSA